jgi:hypothetical protein
LREMISSAPSDLEFRTVFDPDRQVWGERPKLADRSLSAFRRASG